MTSDAVLIALLLREAEGLGRGQLSQLSQADALRASRLHIELKDPKSAVARLAENARQINKDRVLPSGDSEALRALAGDKVAQTLAATLRKIERQEKIDDLARQQFQVFDGVISASEAAEFLRVANDPSQLVGEVLAKAKLRLGRELSDAIMAESRRLCENAAETKRLQAEQAADLDPVEQERAAFEASCAETARLLQAAETRKRNFAELERLQIEAKADAERAQKIEQLKKELA
jgi:hypothetical protein